MNTISVSDIQISLDNFTVPNVPLELLSVSDLFAYEDGQKTDRRLGTRYEVIQPAGKYPRFSVKIQDSSSAITQEDVENALKTSKTIKVEFANVVCKLYVDSKRNIQISISAEDIKKL